MDSLHILDGYCERVGTLPDFWGEPVNAVTNLAFILSALWLFSLARQASRRDPFVLALILVIAAIGTGSFLFHTFATFWALASDVIPIQIFIMSYFGLILNRVHRLGGVLSIVGALLFLPFAFGLQLLLGDSIFGGANAGYIAALILLFGNALLLLSRNHPIVPYLLAGSGVFTLSIAFRMLDEPVCNSVPIGTHFLWHILNAIVLAIVMAGLIRHGSIATAVAGKPTPDK
ncbi:MAG: ceramidase domain-containing protein [Paracoccaceae bacterium]|nr:ceramidase domain-containing protein [Paracoccaceae bacterium]MDE2915181.1 ceramidase domain-containing protein [Paracoccaceae bacterium]